MSERGFPVGVSVLVEFAALEFGTLFGPGFDRLRELGGMRCPGVDRQGHAVLAGDEAVALLQLQQQGHEVSRRLDAVVFERTLGDLERLRDLLQQLGLHRVDAALVVPDRALGEPHGIGELMALTPSDFLLETSELRINKSYQRLRGEDVVTKPKTRKSVRTIKMPEFLRDEMAEFIEMRDDVAPDERLFGFTKHFLVHEMDRGCKASGVKRIRIHDLRHSHVSLLINMGFSALDIAERVGHEAIDITYRYAHLFPAKRAQIADALSELRGE